MPPEAAPEIAPSEQPFPLKRLFARRFVPAFAAFVAAFMVLVGLTARHVIEQVYLQQAQRRAQTVAHAVAAQAPHAWMALMAGATVADLRDKDEAARLLGAFATEVKELRLPELKVYDLARKVLFATHADEIGTTENGEALRSVVDRGRAAVATKDLPDGGRQYELYVPVFDEAERLRVVFELYEPVGYLDGLLIEAAVPSMALPGAMLFALAFALWKLVGRAQADIDLRTRALNQLRRRIETFVSASAVSAARNADATGAIHSRRVTTTLLYSDIRRFTSFAEEQSPEAVVGFLNALMGLQVDAVRRHGGDVDKMIGDALLARFDDDATGETALAAAREIQAAVAGGDFPRRIGIGIFRGEVVSGAVGPADRRDFTVIGDAVNVSARLCSAAGADEIVIDAALVPGATGPTETLTVKGRQAPLTVRRLNG